MVAVAAVFSFDRAKLKTQRICKDVTIGFSVFEAVTIIFFVIGWGRSLAGAQGVASKKRKIFPYWKPWKC